MVIFSKDPMERQPLLEKLHVYSFEWGLRVDIRKTKICVLENRRNKEIKHDPYTENHKKL